MEKCKEIKIHHYCYALCVRLIKSPPPHSKSSLLQAQQFHLSQPLLTGEALQSLFHLGRPMLDSFQYVHLSCTGEHRTEHRTPSMASPMLSRLKGLPLLMCLPYAANTISLLSSKATLLTHVQRGVHQAPQACF